MNKEVIDLLAEFDEMGYAPTTLCKNPEQEAKTWKAQMICEIKRLDAIIQDNADSAATLIAEQKKFAKEQRQLAIKEFVDKLLRVNSKYTFISVPFHDLRVLIDIVLEEYKK